MNVFGKWAPLVGALGSLVGILFFVQRARTLWSRRRQREILARRRPAKSGKSDKIGNPPGPPPG